MKLALKRNRHYPQRDCLPNLIQQLEAAVGGKQGFYVLSFPGPLRRRAQRENSQAGRGKHQDCGVQKFPEALETVLRTE